MSTEIIIIDPQNDFANAHSGALYVEGANEDMDRLAEWIKRNKNGIDDITVTLDSHHKIDVAHPGFWRDQNGNKPLSLTEAIAAAKQPTVISSDDIKKRYWTPVVPTLYEKMVKYVETLEKNGNYPLLIWPEHCLIGTKGAAIVDQLMDALNDWCDTRTAMVNFVPKGVNVFTEHYGAFSAEVPDASDPSTLPNKKLLDKLEAADTLVWTGEAATHCVLSSMKQAFAAFEEESIKKSVVLKDTMSCIPGFEENFENFIKEYEAKGLRVTTTKEFKL